jgi:hypothetical protein
VGDPVVHRTARLSPDPDREAIHQRSMHLAGNNPNGFDVGWQVPDRTSPSVWRIQFGIRSRIAAALSRRVRTIVRV